MNATKDTFSITCDSFRLQKSRFVCRDKFHVLVNIPGHGVAGDYFLYACDQDTLFEKLHVFGGISAQGVSFKDVNADGYQDFILEAYGAAGSGERYLNEVYLYNPGKLAFDTLAGLDLNPHFYPETGIVTCYYMFEATKYKLHGNQLEMLERVQTDVHGFRNKDDLDCTRKIYRYKNGEEFLYKQDRSCDFPKEYQRYTPLKLVF